MCERALEAVQKINQINAITVITADDALEAARASTERYANGAPLSPLDGVPVVIKNEMGMI